MHPPGAGRRRDFRALWAGQTVSLLGSEVTRLALPLTAVLVLQAGPGQMGVLRAAQYLPFLLLGLVAGVWVDRVRRRPIMLWADLGRALLLGSIPAAAGIGVLGLPQLYAVAFLVGVLTVGFDVAYLAYVPWLVPRGALAAANGRLELSRAVAQTAGPGLAGALLQVMAAPVVLAADAASFVASAVALWRIRAPEAAPRQPAGHPDRRGFWREIGEGLELVGRQPVLRTLAGQLATLYLAGGVYDALLVLFALQALGLTPAALGAIFSLGSLAAVGTSVGVARAIGRFGPRPVLTGSLLLIGLGNVLLPVAGLLVGIADVAAPLLALRALLHGVAAPLYNVTTVGLRQVVTPERLQGRVSATIRFVGWGTAPVGALAGGLLGGWLGLLPALGLATGVSLATVLWPVLGLPPTIVPAEPAEPAEPSGEQRAAGS